MRKSLIPADIVQSDLALQSYLVENVKENQKHERIRLRVAKAQHTRINHSLEAAARKITVEPQTQKTKTWKCKKADKTNDFNLNSSAQAQTNEPAEGSLVIEQSKV